MNLCRIVKDQLQHEAEFCLMPYNTLEGYTQVCTAITFRGIEINLLFFAEKYNIKCYVGFDKVKFVWDNNKTEYFDCLTSRGMGRVLYHANKEALLIFLYSLFIDMKRRIDYTAAYAAAAADAIAAAADAIADAADAIADAIADAADAIADAADAAADAIAIAAIADAKRKARIAFRMLIKLRKALLKEGDEEE